MPIQTLNPTTEKIEKTFSEDSEEIIREKIDRAQAAFQSWKDVSVPERARMLRAVADRLEEGKRDYAVLMAREMGRPVTAGVSEIVKCAWVCRYYAENAETMLAREDIVCDSEKSYVRFDPIGIILAVMPWNFPFWQVFRSAAPALMAGNVYLLKHASNVPQCAQAIEDVFRAARFPAGIVGNMFLSSSRVETVVADPRVRAVTLTGSEGAGSAVAAAAGKNLKKSVLELGGSDPFLVFPDCDIESVAGTAAADRLRNAGQTCVAAKRFIIHERIADEFITQFKKHVEEYIVGDPMDERTQMGPLASETILEDIGYQVAESVRKGATILTGGSRLAREGFFFAPTILTNVGPGMPAYDEELFGPVASVIVAHGDEDMIRRANDTPYGLGASIWTRDKEKAERIAGLLDAGFVAINAMVQSDPRLPFGGVKRSGYGRELAQYGIREFVNIKTVSIG
ncbi:NAD-dependent succinate-semialdehyde dehydrogenase [Candidatus Uhrbacteria bacterium]|nr:NAD-dependent succinate-semialdehyde dehydrogenase [Candidatus Uhrbacteria bacterium]